MAGVALDLQRTSTASWAGSRLRTRTIHLFALVGGDLVAIGLATVLALVGRDRLTFFQPTADVASNVLPVAAVFIGLWLLMLALSGAYQVTRVGVGSGEFNAVLLATLLTAGGVGVTAYLTAYDLSRGFFALLFACGLPLLLVERYVTRHRIHALRLRGKLSAPAILVGDAAHVDELAAVLKRAGWLGYQVVGVLTSHDGERRTPAGLPILGSVAEILPALRGSGAQVVIFTEGALPTASAFNRLARQLEDQDAQMVVVPALTDVSAARMNLRPVAGLPLVYVESPRRALAMRFSKRCFDVLGAAAALVVAAPVMGLVALAIKLEDGGPVVFHQIRVGLKGKCFTFHKFRSMTVDAEQRLALLENETGGVLFKVKADPRVTRVGKVLRRFSLDELPQLLNVLNGQMSLVGPRPALPREVALYQQDVHRRLDVRPGLTGLWQVSGRSDLSWEDTVRLDLYYVDNWSLLQDLMILGRTVGAVLRPRGAY